MTYYEQVGVDGRVVAGDCVPCLLVTPIMTRWMLCFEPIDSPGLFLFRGIPRAWLAEGQSVSARGLTTSVGEVGVELIVGETQVEIRVDLPHAAAETPVYVDARLPDGHMLGGVTVGAEHVAGIANGYRIGLKRGTSGCVELILGVIVT